MAERRIAITIRIDNRDAINAAKAQVIAMRGLSEATEKHTHLQGGLTASFVKGNLAARAISVAYLSIRDSMRAALGEAIAFEHTMTKMAAVTGANDTVMRAMGDSVSYLAGTTRQGQNELAKAALEMSKMGLSSAQTQIALEGVAKLARALDEDLTKTGEAVVAVLNTYGLSADQASKVTNQLAFTVKESALSIESFSTAFSYVGGTAAAAGVSLTELQGAMDVLSNSGIRSSTIGTQLRRIIADLSNEGSKAGTVLGGKTLQAYGSLEKALDALAAKNLSASDLTAIFGRTASSVAAILIKYRGVLGDLGNQTENVGNIVDGMTQKMNTTFKSSIDAVKVAWSEMGIQFMQSSGKMKAAVDGVGAALNKLGEGMALANTIKRFKKESFSAFTAVTQDITPDASGLASKALFGFMNPNETDGFSNSAIAEHPIFQKWLQMDRAAKETALRVENIIDELKNTLVRDVKKLSNSDTVGSEDIENTFLFKKLAAEYAGAGHSKAEFLVKLSMARDKMLRELAPPNEGMDGLDNVLKPKKKKAFKVNDASSSMLRMRMSNSPLSQENEDWRRAMERSAKDKDREWKAEQKAQDSMAAFAEKNGRIQSTFKDRTKWLEDSAAGMTALKMSTDAVNGSLDIFSTYLVDGIFSSKEDPFKGISDAFGNFAKKMAADITALLIKVAIFKALLATLSLGGGAGVPFVSALATATTGVKFASGTDQIVRTPTAFVAGDGGAERVKVTPRAKMGSSDEGGGMTIVIQGDVHDYDRFARKVKEAQGSNRRNFV